MEHTFMIDEFLRTAIERIEERYGLADGPISTLSSPQPPDHPALQGCWRSVEQSRAAEAAGDLGTARRHLRQFMAHWKAYCADLSGTDQPQEQGYQPSADRRAVHPDPAGPTMEQQNPFDYPHQCRRAAEEYRRIRKRLQKECQEAGVEGDTEFWERSALENCRAAQIVEAALAGALCRLRQEGLTHLADVFASGHFQELRIRNGEPVDRSMLRSGRSGRRRSARTGPQNQRLVNRVAA